jgi:membrane dipeptidase
VVAVEKNPDDPVLEPRVMKVPERVSARARDLFAKALVWDMTLPYAPGMDDGQCSLLKRFHSVGFDFISLTIAAGSFSNPTDVFTHLGALRARFEKVGGIVLARSVAEIRQAKAEGKLAVGFHFQETLPFGQSLGSVATYYELGVRHALLAYNKRNFVADGCAEESDSRLSNFGVAVVKEMNRIGMMVDVTHVGYRSSMHAMEVSTAPVIFSHSISYEVARHYRNIKDDQIKSCANMGGVIGINGSGLFMGDLHARTATMFRHLDYIVQLVGPRSVGIGLDYVEDIASLADLLRQDPYAWPRFDGRWPVRHNYVTPEQVVELTHMMVEAGYDDEAITGILGENWARVAQQIWK